jgi:mannose-6-phosphate isomerase-like protein (cupin superfamily)
MGYSVVDLDQIEPGGPGGAVRFVRRGLGATAFGINHFTLPPGAFGRQHDERDSGQEEVMFVVSGAGTLHVDGEAVELRPGRFVRLDPETTRVAEAGSEGLAFVTVGAPLEHPYAPRGPF